MQNEPEHKSLDTLKFAEYNPRTISKHDFAKLKQSIKKFGDLSGVVKNVTTGNLVGGHQRIRAFKELNAAIVVTNRFEQPNAVGTVAVGYIELADTLERYGYREVEWDEGTEKAANIAANRIQGEFDNDMLAELVAELNELNPDLLDLTGQTVDEINKLLDMTGSLGDTEVIEQELINMADAFIAPPFSVLDTKQGYWQDRKRKWLSLGLQSELGRADSLLGDKDSMLGAINEGTSVFDPVLCEIIYRWFNVPNGTVLDSFAGGSVRGVIASKLGQQYVGVELRGEQVEANRIQGSQICGDPMPVWIQGDSLDIKEHAAGVEADLFFSCPPYADLEVYSDDPSDLSNMAYPDFVDIYRQIIKHGCDMLKPNRFAVFVVGEVRGKDGAYYNFVGDTIKAFTDAGLRYYNEIILVNTAGTLPLCAGKTFNASRKVGKQHQNVLVFYKGDMKAIKENYPQFDVSKLENEEKSAVDPSTE